MSFIKRMLLVFIVLIAICAQAATERVDGIEWTYTVSGGKASIYKGYNSSAISISTSGAITVPSTLGGYSVTSIGSHAFYYCSQLTSVTIPDSVTSIGNSAFYGCSSLVRVKIPSSCTSIGNQAFGGCKPKEVTVPGWKCNIDFSLVTNLVISEGTLYINSFDYCESLKNVIVPDSVTSIGNSSFKGCSSLVNLTIGNGVTSIGNSAFEGCSSLAAVVMPNGITGIGERAFAGCSSLIDVTIPDNVTSIRRSTFSGCNSLLKITIPESVVSIENYAFYDCSLLKEVHINDVAKWCTISFGSDYANPLCYAHNLYLKGERLVDLQIPDDVLKISSYAFSDCYSLVSVTIPSSVSRIGVYAFNNCCALLDLKIHGSSIWVDNGAFHACELLSSVTILGGFSYFGGAVFDSCENIRNLTISDGLNVSMSTLFPDSYQSITNIVIAEGATSVGGFIGCISLKSVEIPNGVTRIGNRAFYGCSSLMNVTIPNGVTRIGSRAFYGCSSLVSIKVAKSVMSIGEWAFYDCTSLKEVHIDDIAKWCSISFGSYHANPLYCAHNLYLSGEKVTDLWIPEEVEKINAYTFNYCTSIKSVMMSEGVKNIGDFAFDNCISLSDVKISNAVTNIGSYAFSYCNSLVGVAFGARVLRIGNSAFRGCSSLTDVVIPDSVTNIGDSVFSDCSSLSSVIIGDGVTSIGKETFCRCTSLVDVTIGENVASIGIYAFNGCSSLKNMIMPDSVTSIGGGAFINCRSLTSVTIPNNVVSIGTEAFRFCSSLASITIPDSVTNLGVDVFTACGSLTNVTIGSGVTDIGDLFSGCTSLEKFEVSENNESYLSQNGMVFSKDGKTLIYGVGRDVIIPDGVIRIDSSAFSSRSSLVSVTIPSSVTDIGSSAFSYCSTLTSINIPNSVTSIGVCAFFGCSSLKTIAIPSSVENIEDRTFVNCSSLEYIIIPNGLASIGEYAFSGCASLKKVVIPISVVEVGQGAFSGCDKLETVTVPGWKCNIDFSTVKNLIISEGTTSIADFAFSSSSSLLDVKIPDSVMSIGNQAFGGCSSLHQVTIPDGVERIGEYAFSGCASLKKVVIPVSVVEVGQGAFSGCDKLETVTVPGWKCNIDFSTVKNLIISEGTASIADFAFSGSSSLLDVKIPNSVISIGNQAFDGCSSLHQVIIPDGVERIGEYAFSSCSLLGKVVIPVSVVEVGQGAFSGCDKLETVTVPGWKCNIDFSTVKNLIISDGITSIADSAFSSSSSLSSVILPNSVTNIGSDVFAECAEIRCVHIPYVTGDPLWMAMTFPNSYANITNVVLFGNVTRIADKFFFGCDSLNSVLLPEGLTNIAITAFSGCRNLESVSWCATNIWYRDAILKGDDGIGGFVFGDLFIDSKLTLKEMKFAEGVISLPDGCLNGLEAVKRVEIPSTLERFGDNDLRSLSKVTNGLWIEQGWVLGYMGTASGTVEIPEGVKGIASYAFEGQTLLDNVTLPSTLKYVGVNAFKSCTNLEDIDLPEGVVRVEDGAFRNCTYAQTVKLPSSLQEIGDSAFENCTSFSGVECPESVRVIGEGAFSNCWRMLSVSLPVGLESVGTNAFLDCRRLIGVSVPTHLKAIKELFPSAYANLATIEITDTENTLVPRIFAECSSLIEVEIPEGIRLIPEEAFVGCSAVQSFNLPNAITNIGARAFSGLTQMTSFAFPAEVETIADEAFAGCVNLASLSLPEGVQYIGRRAFSGLSLLTRADIPGTVVEMGDSPFAGCGQVRAVSMPGNVATVKSLFPDAYGEIVSASVTVGTTCVVDRLFSDCTKLTSVDLPFTLVEIGEYAFENCTFLSDMGIPSGVERLGEGAFLNCASLAKIALPNRLVIIPYRAFAGCETLAEIVIPENVSELDDSIFVGCSRLSKVYFVGNAPSCTVSTYDGVSASLVTYVENGSTGWDGIETSKTLPEFWPEGTSNLITYWTPNRYDVTFNLSGGGDSFDVEQVTGTTYILPLDPKRKGAVFDGWWTSLDGGARVTAVTPVDLTRPHTFYARWKFNAYSVVFDANGGSGEMEDQRLTVETPVQLPENGFTRPGYEFLGWAIAPDGEVVYSDKAEVVNLAYDNNAIVTLYAVWNEREWTWADAVNATSIGLVFSGDGDNDAEWEIDYSTSYDGVASLRSGSIGVSTAYPERTMSTVKTVVVGEGIGEFWWKVNCEEMDAKHDEWYDYVVFTINGEEVAKIAGDSGWQKVEYAVMGAGKHTLAWTFTRDDYDEEGAEWENAAWLDEFVWTPNPVTVTFDAGGADGEVPDSVVKYAGYELTLPGAGTLNNGEYVFRGWSDGETTYQAGSNYVFGSDDVILTAVWELKVWAFAEVADAEGLVLTTGGDADWTIDATSGYTNTMSVKSGVVVSGQESWIETKVNGSGILTFRWKVMGGQNRNNPFAYAKVVVDDTEVASEYLTDDWEEVSLTIEGDKGHTVRWIYLRTSTRPADGDCAWLDAIVWTPAASADLTVDVGGGKSVVVPIEWIDKYESLVVAAGGDKAAALQQTAANGRKVWECFMLGVDPTKADDDFKITRFWMEGGKPMFEFSHSTDGAGNSFMPRIKPLGKAKLSDSWQDVPVGGDALFRFFTVEVALP